MAKRITGIYSNTTVAGETVQTFTPYPLPPKEPPLQIQGNLSELHDEALATKMRLRFVYEKSLRRDRIASIIKSIQEEQKNRYTVSSEVLSEDEKIILNHNFAGQDN